MNSINRGMWITGAAVGVAMIFGVTAPVRAAVVTYDLENAELSNNWEVTGSLNYDTDDGIITGGSVTVDEGGGVTEQLNYVVDATPNATSVQVADVPSNAAYAMDILFGDASGSAVDLTGQADQTVDILTSSSYLNGNTQNTFDFTSGTVTDAPVGQVPEPSSIMATVTAVMIGVVLRRKKRKI
jgi:hypothetical protein